MKNRYSTIDLMKFLFSFLVIAIHTRPFRGTSLYADYFLSDVLSRIAVPFFFAVSGYFLCKKMALFENKSSQILLLFKKTLIIYFTSSLFYFIIRIFESGERMLSTPMNYVKDILFYETYYHLWYFHAVLFAGLVICLLSRRFSMKNIFLVSLLFYVMGLLFSSYFGLITSGTLYEIRESYLSVFKTPRNGLFFGLPFMSLGVWKASGANLEPRKHMYRWLILFGFLLVVESSIIFRFNLSYGNDMYLSLIPITYLLLSIGLKPSHKKYTLPVGRMSAVLFLVHPFFIFLLQRFSLVTSNLSLFFAVSLLSFLASLFYVKINN